MTQQSKEYAIEVPGKGYLQGSGAFRTVNPDPDFQGQLTLEEALKELDSARVFFRRLQLPEIADSLRLVYRVTTVTRTDWAPVELVTE